MRLFGHQPRSTLPSLHPITVNYPKKEKSSKVKDDYNQHARTLPDLQPGTVVRMRLPLCQEIKDGTKSEKSSKNVLNHVRISYLMRKNMK